MTLRSFSKLEKETIRTVVRDAIHNPAYLLINAYNDIFLYTNITYVNGELQIYYSKEEFDRLEPNATLVIQQDIIVKTLLLRYLVNLGLIYLVPDNNVEPFKTDVDLANKKGRNYKISVDLPQDIQEFLNECFKRVVISEELKVLVVDNFKSAEDKLLEGINNQIRNIQIQTGEIEEQRESTNRLVYAAERQTAEALKQTQKISEQTALTLTQTKEAQSQTEEARKQTEQAILQTAEAQKQTTEAQEQTAQALLQTQEAKKQTEEALKQTTEALRQTEEAQKQTAHAKKQTGLNIAVLICSIFALAGALVTVFISNKQREDALNYNQQSLELQGTIDSVQTNMIQSIDKSAYDIKQNTDTLLLRQKETNRNILRINSTLKDATK